MKQRIKSLLAASMLAVSISLTPIAIVATSAVLVGCGTVYTIAVTISNAEDAVMKEWATLHNDNRTTDDLDRKVMAAHAKFNEAKLIAANALRAYNSGGDKADYVKALEAARDAIGPIIDLIQPLLTPANAQNLRVKAAAATKL